MLSNGQGNCYRYASSFAYIARALGYEARVAVGTLGRSPHGWTEVLVGDTWYLCDANMQRNHPEWNSYLCTEATYPYGHTRSATYRLWIVKGQVSWS